MWPAGRSRLGGATTDENLYPNAAAPTALHKPNNPAASSSAGGATGGMTPGTGAKAAARKALGLLGSANKQGGNIGLLEDQARIKEQKGLGKDGSSSSSTAATRPRRALGEITNRVAPPPPSSANNKQSSLQSSSAAGPSKPSSSSSPSSGLRFDGNKTTKLAPPSAAMVPATALADLPSFSDDDEEVVDDVELPAGRLGEEEERLVAQKRAAKEAQEDAAFLRKVDGMLAHSARQRDEAFDAYADGDDEASFGGVNLEEGEEEDVMPPGFDASSLASAMDDLALALDDLDLPVDL